MNLQPINPYLRRTAMSHFIPPTLDEVKAYAAEIGLSPTEAERLWVFYEMKNWVVGRTQMKKWRMAVAGWKLRIGDSAMVSSQSSPAHLILKQKALDRCEARIKWIKDELYHHDHYDMAKKTAMKTELRELIAEQGKLKGELGFKA